MSREPRFSFELMSSYFYYVALLDMLAGIPFHQIENSILFYEEEERYEACDGIKRALEVAEHFTLRQLERHIVEFEIANKEIIDDEFTKLEMYL